MARYDDDVTLMMMDYYNNRADELLTTYYLTPISGGNEPVPVSIFIYIISWLVNACAPRRSLDNALLVPLSLRRTR